MPVPIGKGQTLSQPWIVARMMELAELQPHHTVLDVGSGSGYQTALLAQLCHHVHGVEIVPELVLRARAVLAEVGVRNATIHVADGSRGLPEHGPYAVIMVAAAAQAVPERLLEQLADGGRLIVPIGRQMSKSTMAVRMLLGRKAAQRLNRFTRRGERFEREVLEGVHFVPFVGA
jgi:protein-L-isoaspartate(D-aspartate) O-methyltransferase